MLRTACLILFFIASYCKIYAQYPVADFSVPVELCIDGNVKIQNYSQAAISYEWDFCLEGLKQLPSSHNFIMNSDFNRISNIALVKDSSNWYGFLPSRSGKSIIRLEFGSSLLNHPKILNLGTFSNKFNQPIDIEFIKENGLWYALIVDIGANKIFRLNFSSIKDENPLLEELTSFNSLGLLNAPVDVEILQEEGELTAIITNYNVAKITHATFGSSITNSAVGKNYDIVGGSNLRGISAIKVGTSWELLISSYSNNKIFSVRYKNGLSNAPEVGALLIDKISIDRPVGISLVKEGFNIYAFVQSYAGNLYKLSDLDKAQASGVSLGNFTGLTSGNQSVDFASSEGKWYGFILNVDANKISRISFPDNCAYVSLLFSVEENAYISYDQGGQYAISLTAYDEFGNKDDIIQYTTVAEKKAPIIDFQLSSQCVGSESTITPICDQVLISSDWIINGEAKSGNVVTYVFPASGIYEITLEAESENGCSNLITKEITIYEPPDPSFSIPSGTICSNGTIAFTNLTDTKGADELITYHWDFNGEGTSTAANPSFTFATGGTKMVTLTASIPGCSEAYTKTIEIAQGPIVNFNVPYICQGVEVQFENLTSGAAITEYHWDFGNGESFTTTSAEPPFYTYQTEGSYTATLAVKNAIGCNNVASKTFTVYARPQVNFLVEVACSGSPVRFTDQTTAGTTSNVVDWQWDFGDGSGTANIRNPEYTYTQQGTYLVKLVAQTSTGCKDSLVQEVIVESPVTPDFSYSMLCDEEPYTLQFNDASTVEAGDKITAWLWHIQGESFATADVQYTFEAPGTYEVALTTFAASACHATLTRTIEVLPRPEVAFTYTVACVGEPFSFNNTTSSEEGVVSSYTWGFGGAGASFEVNPQFTFTEPSTYVVLLTAQTLDHCTFSSKQTIHVEAQPVAKFTPSATYGAYPLTVQLDNQSEHATQYTWYIGAEDTLTEASPAFTFTQPGQYEVVLVAENTSGCISSESHLITVVEPMWDMVLESMMILPAEDNGAHQVVLTIRNAGTVTVTRFPISIKVDQLLELKENFEGTLAPGEKISYPVSFTLSSQVNRNVSIGYICATLLNGDASLPDVRLSNNRLCVNMADAFSSMIPYPNPVKDVLDVSLVLPQAEQVDIRVQSSQGKQLRSYSFSETHQGLNSFAVDMSGLAQGTYLVQVHYLGKMKLYRVVVHP